jgi:hypothetical protein
VGRTELGPADRHAPRIAGPVESDGPLLVALGDVLGEAAEQLAVEIRRLDPHAHPSFTVDLRQATAIDPLVIHALLHARNRRGDEWGAVRLLVAPGNVERFLNHPRFHRLFEIVHSEEEGASEPADFAGEWEPALLGSLDHYHHLLEITRRRDLPALRAAAQEAHPICVAAGAQPGGPVFGEWCRQCPVRHVSGGCQPLVAHMLRAAEHGNWEAAQMLILSLIAEASGVTRPAGAPGPGAGTETSGQMA